MAVAVLQQRRRRLEEEVLPPPKMSHPMAIMLLLVATTATTTITSFARRNAHAWNAWKNEKNDNGAKGSVKKSWAEATSGERKSVATRDVPKERVAARVPRVVAVAS